MVQAPLWVAAVVVLELCFPFPSALAYIPPPSFILKTLAAKHQSEKGLRVRSNLLIRNQTQFKLVHLYHSGSGILRTTLVDEAGQIVYRFNERMNSNAVSLDIPIHAIGTLLMNARLSQLVQVLRKNGVTLSEELNGVAIDPTFLSRWNKTIAWVIGERSSTAPQFWVEKDTFLPLRWKGAREVQFQEFQSFKSLPYPKKILILNGTQASEVEQVLLKETLVELKLDPPELAELEKGSALHESVDGFTNAAQSLSPQIRSAIQGYFEAP